MTKKEECDSVAGRPRRNMSQGQKEKIIPVDKETMMEFLETGHCVVKMEKGRIGRIGSVVPLSDNRITSSAKIDRRYRNEGGTHLVLLHAR